MSAMILFPTTSLATVDVVYDLNKNCSEDRKPVLFNTFNPARHDVKNVVKTSTDPVDLEVENFEGSSWNDLLDIFTRDYKPLAGGGYQITQNSFAVLDKQGVEDKTILLYSEDPQLDENDEPVSANWLSWRVRWKDSYGTAVRLDGESMEVFTEVLVKGQSKFSDDKGIFNLNRALKESGYKN